MFLVVWDEFVVRISVFVRLMCLRRVRWFHVHVLLILRPIYSLYQIFCVSIFPAPPPPLAIQPDYVHSPHPLPLRYLPSLYFSHKSAYPNTRFLRPWIADVVILLHGARSGAMWCAAVLRTLFLAVWEEVVEERSDSAFGLGVDRGNGKPQIELKKNGPRGLMIDIS